MESLVLRELQKLDFHLDKILHYLNQKIIIGVHKIWHHYIIVLLDS